MKKEIKVTKENLEIMSEIKKQITDQSASASLMLDLAGPESFKSRMAYKFLFRARISCLQ